MKKFEFKLEPLYKLRKNIEKQKQAEVAEVSAEYNKEKNAIDNCFAKINDSINIIDSIEDSEDKINMIIYAGDYINALNSQIAIHEDNASIIEIELKKRQKALQEATQNRRAVEMLKEKKILEYKNALKKEEQSKLDEWKKNYIF